MTGLMTEIIFAAEGLPRALKPGSLPLDEKEKGKIDIIFVSAAECSIFRMPKFLHPKVSHAKV